MKKILFCLMFLCGSAFADLEILAIDGEVAPTDWASSNADSKVNNLTDGIEGEYIVEVTNGDNNMFTFANTTFFASATVDSLRITYRGRDNGSGNNKVQLVLYTEADSYCLGVNKAMTTSWVDYNDPYLAAPSGVNTCAGTLTKAVVDALQVRCDVTSLGGSKEINITDIDLYVFYTPAGGRSRIMIINGDN